LEKSIYLILLALQIPLTLVLLSRLSTAPSRILPLGPLGDRFALEPKVTVIIPTLNEILRLPACLEGLRHQAVGEIIVVDSCSQDGTPEFVRQLQADYPSNLRLISDAPLPSGWVGRPWALHTGFLNASPDSEWILGLDADTQPQPGLVASLVQQAIALNYDIVSLSPRFILKTAGEQWLQPALLMTLIYRFGATGDRAQFSNERVMANGQCFLARKSVMSNLGGYELAKASFCDDVTLARAAAIRGAKVAFLDGAKVLQVRMYTSMAETWREWGRSLDLKDASSRAQIWGDLLFLLAVQGLPLPLLILSIIFAPLNSVFSVAVLCLNAGLVLVRIALMLAIRSSYTDVGFWFWLSPLADPLAVLRIFISSVNKPKQWRGRIYQNEG
jgi:dolichol-phosphate mannosyltransferase